MIQSVLIANRGAIATRIIRTLKAMGVRAISVYAEADRESLHVQHADESVRKYPSKKGDVNEKELSYSIGRTVSQALHVDSDDYF